jgi:hypothetical protein
VKLQYGDPVHVFEGGMSSSSSIYSCIGCQVDYCSCELKLVRVLDLVHAI